MTGFEPRGRGPAINCVIRTGEDMALEKAWLLIGFAAVLAIAALVVFLLIRWTGSSSTQNGALAPEDQPYQVVPIYTQLRDRALHTPAADLGLAHPHDNTVPFAVLMEMGTPKAVVSLVAFSTGDASLYFSTGGGVIGGIGHERVVAAARRLVSQSQELVPSMMETKDTPLPKPGRLRFYVRTQQGLFVAEAAEQDLIAKKNDLWPLFYAGNDLITELRLVAEPKQP